MTVKQLADELNISKTTIKNIMKKHNITAKKELINGQYIIVLSSEEADAIRNYFRVNHPQGANTENEPQTPKNISANTENQTANHTKNSANSANNEITESLVKLLQQDLEAKNKQIEDLNNRLAEAMKALDQEQQLKAIAEKKILELEAKTEDKNQTEEKIEKKGFLKRLFKK